MKKLIEICAVSTAVCVEAAKAGAKRAELCVNLEVGGTTPSYGLMVTAQKRAPDLALNILIRPRGGDFVYSEAEIQEMLADIELCKQLNMNGVVVGALTREGAVDTAALAAFVAAARPLPVTFHRAFDAVRDPFAALETIIAAGCERILTSGCKPNAEAGSSFLGELVKRAGKRIIIMPGGGIRRENIEAIARASGASELHSSSLDVLKWIQPDL